MKKTVLFLAMIEIITAGILHAEEITWQQCVGEALKNSSQVISARETLNQAKASSWVSTSSILPQISASASASKSGSEPSADATPSIINQVAYNPANTYSNSYSYGLSARQLVFDGFKSIQDIMKSSNDDATAELTYKNSSASVRYNLRQAFIGLMKSQRLVVITDQIYQLRQKQYNDIKLRYNAGRENKGSLMSSEADMEQARVEVEQAKSALELSKLSLCNQLGRDKATDISVKEDFNFATVTDKDPDFDAAIKENLSVMIAVSNRHSAEYALSSAVSSCLPSVSLSGSLGRGGNRLLPEDTQWSLGLGMSFSIFDGGKSAADILSYTAALNRAKADEKGTIQNTRYSLMSVWNDFKNSVLDLGAQQKYMDSTQENAKIADAQYSTGLIQFNNWTIIQNSLVSYEKSFLSAQANVLTKEAAWIQAKGGTLEDEK